MSYCRFASLSLTVKLDFLKWLGWLLRDIDVEELIFVLAYGYYHEIPAILMDSVNSTNYSVSEIHSTQSFSNLESNGFWILGKSFSQINISPKKETKCENFSCYEKSLKTNKICKPGIL